jgi:nucleoside-diphosphate-sugar epimerase
MRVFITGASGWIGSGVTPEVLAAGHEVVGLARSEASAARLRGVGAEVLTGDLDDLDALRRGAEQADAVIHLANKHDWSNPAESNRAERAAVETLGDTLAGTGKRLLLASGTALVAPGTVITEDMATPFRGADAPRGGTEALAFDYVERGVHSVSLRFAPTVHGEGDHGFIALIAQAARRAGVAGYPGDGTNRWSAVARSDAAKAVALALEKAEAGSVVHAVGEESVTSRAIAEALGAALGLPVAAVADDDIEQHFGFIGGFYRMDIPASSALTQQRLGWTPVGSTLADDIAAGYYPGN